MGTDDDSKKVKVAAQCFADSLIRCLFIVLIRRDTYIFRLRIHSFSLVTQMSRHGHTFVSPAINRNINCLRAAAIATQRWLSKHDFSIVMCELWSSRKCWQLRLHCDWTTIYWPTENGMNAMAWQCMSNEPLWQHTQGVEANNINSFRDEWKLKNF